MATGKKLGFKKGDFVYTGLFPAIIISDVHTYAPCCEVWGVEHEMGSVYASDLRKLTYAEFVALAIPRYDGTAYSKEARAAIAKAKGEGE